VGDELQVPGPLCLQREVAGKTPNGVHVDPVEPLCILPSPTTDTTRSQGGRNITASRSSRKTSTICTSALVRPTSSTCTGN
jgi:hypothetical protein